MIKKLLFTLLVLSSTITFSQTTHVPDDNFEQALIDLGYDDVLDDYIATENIVAVKDLDLSVKGILDLTGIEDFNALETLNCNENFRDEDNIREINLSSNIHLKEFYCSFSLLTTLDLTNNPSLEVLVVPFSFLQNINLTQNTNLKRVDLSVSQISTLDFSNNLLIEDLYINIASIQNIDLTDLSNLKILNIQQGAYTSIDLSQNTNLDELQANSNLNLNCIQVQNITAAEANENWFKNDSTNYSKDCTVSFQDSDHDGVPDDLDKCPNTQAGTIVDADGCLLSIADLVLENILISIGSDPCLVEPSCYISMKSLKNFPLNIYIETGNNEAVFEGILNQSNPIALNDLAEGDYNILVVGNEFLPVDYGWKVSFNSDNNEIKTTVGITKPNQTYSIGVSGSTTYSVNVNGETTSVQFESVNEQQLEIPLVLGVNNITVNGLIECGTADNTEEEEDDSGKGTGMLLFPTLSNGLITIENSEEKQIHGITVTGLNGIRTKYLLINGNPKTMYIDMKGAAKGMYIVRIQQASGKAIIKKILIQ